MQNKIVSGCLFEGIFCGTIFLKLPPKVATEGQAGDSNGSHAESQSRRLLPVQVDGEVPFSGDDVYKPRLGLQAGGELTTAVVRARPVATSPEVDEPFKAGTAGRIEVF